MVPQLVVLVHCKPVAACGVRDAALWCAVYVVRIILHAMYTIAFSCMYTGTHKD